MSRTNRDPHRSAATHGRAWSVPATHYPGHPEGCDCCDCDGTASWCAGFEGMGGGIVEYREPPAVRAEREADEAAYAQHRARKMAAAYRRYLAREGWRHGPALVAYVEGAILELEGAAK